MHSYSGNRMDDLLNIFFKFLIKFSLHLEYSLLLCIHGSKGYTCNGVIFILTPINFLKTTFQETQLFCAFKMDSRNI